MRPRKIMTALGLAGVLAAAAPVNVPAQMDKPESMDQETWARLRDDVLEYDEIADLVEICGRELGKKEQDQVFPILFEQMNRELDRSQEDIDWLIEKYDYRNADKSWKNSQDAVQRTMQKIVGGHPADPVFRCKK